MMPIGFSAIDLTGQRFGHLVVLARAIGVPSSPLPS
jgi:hypothetical protein